MNDKRKKLTTVFCANCGGIGHIYKTCNHPVISYGIICYKLQYDKQTNSMYPVYMMVQRKDSLSYVEFIRGKYSLNKKDYLLRLFMNMTSEERLKIECYKDDFLGLWNSMWCRNQAECSKYNKEYNESMEKFAILSTGFNLVNPITNESSYISLQNLLNLTESIYNETEWGFPKGRRNINEDDIVCAIREFREETGIQPWNIRVCRDIKPLEEIFTGSNEIRYKHVYYIARYQGHLVQQSHFNPENTTQNKEIKDVQWFSYAQAQEKIRKENIERKELFKRLNHIVMRGFHY